MDASFVGEEDRDAPEVAGISNLDAFDDLSLCIG